MKNNDYDHEQLGLFNRYPYVPGAQNETTSRAAAESMLPAVGTIRAHVLAHVRQCGAHGATADEVADALALSKFTARPRCTELFVMGLTLDSGRRRRNDSGRMAIVWVAPGL